MSMSEDTKMEETKGSASNKGRIAWRIGVAACLILMAAAVILRLLKPEEAIETTPLSTVSVTHPDRQDISI